MRSAFAGFRSNENFANSSSFIMNLLEYRIIPGTPGRSYPFSGIFYKEIVLEKDPGNGTQSARSARKDGANV
jgi:hypothetical protein